MSDLKLFHLSSTSATEVQGTGLALEKSLQTLIEQNLETFLGVRFLASEFSTGSDHGGRMDTLGLDENGCPVIIEYKRSTNMNVINQGLFYLDWLVTHRGDFEMLVLKTFGGNAAQSVEWSSPRLICIAGDFSKFDEHAIKQMNRNIDLIRYVKFGDDLLLLEQINATVAPMNGSAAATSPKPAAGKTKYTTVAEHLEKADVDLTDLYEAVKDHMMGLGDDVQHKTLRLYFAFKRIKNFACVEIKNQDKKVMLYLKVDPGTVDLSDGFTRDVRKIGHFGTGDLEVTIRSLADFDRAKLLIERSYESA
jgi:predicted transport protein